MSRNNLISCINFLILSRSSNVRRRISNFWKQAAAAALRHQEQQTETEAGELHLSSSHMSGALDAEEANAWRSLTSIFRHSWPSLAQVTCWQQSFQNLLQDQRML